MTLKAYNNLAGELKLEKLQSVKVDTKLPEKICHSDLMKRLKKCVGWQGWICYQDGICILPCSLLEDSGKPLCGEMVNDSKSLHFYQRGNDEWVIVPISEGAGNDVLVDEVTRANNQHAHARMLYRRYWRHEAGKGYVAYAVRFIGFEEEGHAGQ